MMNELLDESWFDDPDRPLCCALSRFSFRCTLPIGHKGMHEALDPDDQPLDRWAS